MDFPRTEGYDHHQCQAYRDGNWIVYTCPHCDYEMRDNWRTGELVVRNAKRDVNHSGSYFPQEYASAFESVN